MDKRHKIFYLIFSTYGFYLAPTSSSSSSPSPSSVVQEKFNPFPPAVVVNYVDDVDDAPLPAGRIKLDASALRVLASGKPYYKTLTQRDRIVEAIVVQDVNAMTHKIWEILVDFDNYSRMIPTVQFSESYQMIAQQRQQQQQQQQQLQRGGVKKQQKQVVIYTHLKSKMLFISSEIFVRHLLVEESMSLSWTLDHSSNNNNSDFLDNIFGSWYVTPHPTKLNWSRVYYSIHVSFNDLIPKMFIKMLNKKCLRIATRWVKLYSEEGTAIVKFSHPRHTQQHQQQRKAIMDTTSSGVVVEQQESLRERMYCTLGDNGEQSSCSPDELILEKQKQPIGIWRYILVGMVFILTLANLYLCLERMV